MAYALGWDPRSSAAARARLLASLRYCTVAPRDQATLPPALSLSQYLLRALEQLQAGTCWLHAAVCLAETVAVARGYEAIPVCRRLVGYEGKRLEGGGNPSNGGNGIDALDAMTAEKGVGLAHEDLCPYTDDYRTLGTKPPQSVYDDARKSHLVLPVDVRSNDEMRTLLSVNTPTCIGTWWPYGFDNRQTFMTSIGSGTYGHELTVIGYVMKGVWPGDHGQHAWWQVRNWHGQLYPPLPPDLAALVPGYKSDTPDTTSDAWWSDECMVRLQGYGNFEMVSAADVVGLESKVVIPSFLSAFPF